MKPPRREWHDVRAGLSRTTRHSVSGEVQRSPARATPMHPQIQRPTPDRPRPLTPSSPHHHPQTTQPPPPTIPIVNPPVNPRTPSATNLPLHPPLHPAPHPRPLPDPLQPRPPDAPLHPRHPGHLPPNRLPDRASRQGPPGHLRPEAARRSISSSSSAGSTATGKRRGASW